MIEFACGTGRVLRMLHDVGYSCIGVDLSPEMSAYAHHSVMLSTEVINADMISTPFKAGGFAASLNVLSSISCLDGMKAINVHLRDASRILSSHGIYVIDFLLGVPRKRREHWQIQRGQDRYEVSWEITGISQRRDKFVEEIEVRSGVNVLQSKAQTTIIPAKDFRAAVSKAGFKVEAWFRPFRARPLHNQPTGGRVIAVLRKMT